MTYVKKWRGFTLALQTWLLNMRFWRNFESTPPNWLTIARILGSPLIPVMVVIGYLDAVLWYCLCLALSDFFDGVLARAFGWKSTWGAKWDPRADGWFSGATILGAFIFLPFNLSHSIEMLVTTGIMVREAVLQLLRRNGDVLAPKLEFERTKFFVYMVATGFMLARFTHVELLWDAYIPLSLYWAGFAIVVVVNPFFAYLATIWEKAAEFKERRKTRKAKEISTRTD